MKNLLLNLNHVQRLIKMGDAKNYQQYLQGRGISMAPRNFQNSCDLMKYLKSVDLSIALDLLTECSCIFHDDVHPSATIFRSNSGDYLYYCRTVGCAHGRRGMNILQIVQAIQSSTRREALGFLNESFNVGLEPRKQPSSKNLFEENFDALKNKFQEKSPTAFEYLNTTVLVALYDFGQKSMNMIDCTGRKSITFSVSNGQLREELGASRNFQISLHLAQLEYLGFIHRLTLYELDDKRYQNMMKYLDTKRSFNQRIFDENAKKLRILPTGQIQVYLLSDELLALIEENAKQWIQMKYKVTAFTYNHIYEKEGCFVAHKMYPCGDWLHGEGKSFVNFENDVKAILERELSRGEYLSLQALKKFMIEQKDWSNKRIQKYLKVILDKFCEEDYIRTRVDKKAVIKKRLNNDTKAA